MTTPIDGVGNPSKAGDPPSPPGQPVLGHTYQFFCANPLDWFTNLAVEYGDVVQLDVAGQTVILLSNPDDIEHVLIANNQNYRKGGFQKLVTNSLLGNGLVLAEGDEWRAHRRGLEPAFHPDRMPDYARRIRSHTERLLNRWSSGDVIDLEEEMKRLTLRIIADALFGVDLAEELAQPDEEILVGLDVGSRQRATQDLGRFVEFALLPEGPGLAQGQLATAGLQDQQLAPGLGGWLRRPRLAERA